MKLPWLIALMFMCSVSTVHSQQVKMMKTTLQLKDECEFAEQLIATAATQPVPQMVTAKGVSCFGYLRGYLDATTHLQSVRGAKPIYCGDPDRDLRKLAAGFVTYVNAHPDQTSAPAAESVANFIVGIDPCKP